jgi:hypothetical protein
MSSARAQANHRLYLARILLASWRDALDRQELPAATLAQAFDEAVREHLLAAYGWFLLEITRPEPPPAAPPRGCAELPPTTVGKARPGEIRELAQLESGGWLRPLLAGEASEISSPRSAANLAVPAPAAAEHQQLAQLADRLESLFDRMGTFLDEY